MKPRIQSGVGPGLLRNISKSLRKLCVQNIQYNRSNLHHRWTHASIFVVVSLAIALPVFVFGRAQADTLPVVNESGTLNSNATWTPDNVYLIESQLTIPDGITLTIQAGTIVKYKSGWGYNSITVASGGTLEATGTSINPVIFTSDRDDSIGGDTNGDGSATSPAFGDYSTAVATSSYGTDNTISIAHGEFLYGSQAVSVDCTGSSGNSVNVTDSVIKGQLQAQYCEDGVVLFKRNQFELPSSTSSPAAYIYGGDPSGIVLGGTDENTFTGSGEAVAVHVQNTVINSGLTWTVSGTSGAVVWSDGLTVDGTLNLVADAVVKISQYNNGFTVGSGGTLEATGTSSDPVVFTSLKDDSVGGDTNGDGSATSPAFGDYGAAITTDSYNSSNATVGISHAEFRYGGQPIAPFCTGNSNVSFTIDDSIIKGQVYIVNCEQGSGSVLLRRNQFELPSGSGYTAVNAQGSDPSGIVLGGTDENTFTGSGQAITVLVANNNPTVSTGSTWVVNGTSGAVIETSGISISGTLNLGAGAVIKMTPYGTGFYVASGGTLEATGTSINPVIFTSDRDDSIGGDTNGDGSATSPAFGDYSTAITTNSYGSSNATVGISHAEFRHGNQSMSPICTGNDDMSVSLTDSVIKDQVYAVNCGQGVILVQRNQFELPSSSGYQAVYFQGGDPSGITLNGTNENTFTGSGKSHVVLVQNGEVSTGSTWVIDGTGGAVVEVSQVSVSGTVDINYGAIVKINGNFGFDVADDGIFDATGTSTNPVIFTSSKDDSVGGDTNGDGQSSAPTTGDYGTAIRFEESGSSDHVSYVVFKYAGSTISIGTWSILSVDNVQFTNNGAAFVADTTTTENPILGSLAPECLWPYGNTISISNSWFGSGSGLGVPGSSMDISGYLGQQLPDGYPGLANAYNDFTTLMPLVGNLGDNTLPWTLFYCDIIAFPVTPVNLVNFVNGTAIASSPLWTDTNLVQ